MTQFIAFVSVLDERQTTNSSFLNLVCVLIFHFDNNFDIS